MVGLTHVSTYILYFLFLESKVIATGNKLKQEQARKAKETEIRGRLNTQKRHII